MHIPLLKLILLLLLFCCSCKLIFTSRLNRYPLVSSPTSSLYYFEQNENNAQGVGIWMSRKSKEHSLVLIFIWNNKNKKSNQKLANGQFYQMPNRQTSHASIQSIVFIGSGRSILKNSTRWRYLLNFSLLSEHRKKTRS